MLIFYVDIWKLYTIDPYILSAVEGLKQEFDSVSIQVHLANGLPFSQEEQSIVYE